MKIISLNNALKASFPRINYKRLIKFNNSIIHLEDDLYLMSYRVWFDDKHKVIPKKSGDKGHPWYSIWKEKKYDGTGIALLRIDNNDKVTVISDNIERNSNGRVDVRVFRMIDGKLYVNFNSWDKIRGHGFDNSQVEEHNCKGEVCTLYKIAQLNLTKYNNRNINYHFTKEKIFCKNYVNIIEKNWSHWIDNKNCENKFSYSISPNHTILDHSKKNCKYIKKQFLNFYRLEKAYDWTIYFSLTTPAIKYSDNLNIAVGHCKVNTNKLRELERNDKHNKLIKFINKNIKKSTVMHYGGLIYFMYFYIFNDKGKILRMSDCFIPNKSNPYLLVFPMGITQKNNDPDTFYVSYGEGDFRSKLMVINRKKIESLVKPAESINIDNYKFKILKTSQDTLTKAVYSKDDSSFEFKPHDKAC